MSSPSSQHVPQSDSDFRLQLAIQHALSDTREAPWYGVYGLLLRPLEVVEKRETSTTATIVFPQYPVAITIREVSDEVFHIIPRLLTHTDPSSTPVRLGSAALSLPESDWTPTVVSSPLGPLRGDVNVPSQICQTSRSRIQNSITTTYGDSSPDPLGRYDVSLPSKSLGIGQYARISANSRSKEKSSPNDPCWDKLASSPTPVHEHDIMDGSSDIHGNVAPAASSSPNNPFQGQPIAMPANSQGMDDLKMDSVWPRKRLRVSNSEEPSSPNVDTPVLDPFQPQPMSLPPPRYLPGLEKDFIRQRKRHRVSDSDEPSPTRMNPCPIPLLTTSPTAEASIRLGDDIVDDELKLLATQIPDFVRYVFFRTKKGLVKRADLIVENKRTYKDPSLYLNGLAIQCFNQAQYVLANDKDVEVVACIMAIGEYWVYREVGRNDVDQVQMEEEIRVLRGKDTIYVPSPEPTNSSSSFARAPSPPAYPFRVRQDTNSETFMRLQEVFPASNSMLSINDKRTPGLFGVVHMRLKEINHNLWRDEEED
jgi:hypothetical protein